MPVRGKGKEKERAVKDVRVHFVHLKSERRDVGTVPLLLVPGFPFTGLSVKPEVLEELVKEGFDVVVPSLPGLGFSDAFEDEGEGDGEVLWWTAGVLDAVMGRLGYAGGYLVSGMGSGREERVDYWVPRLMGEGYPGRCLGVHLLDPVVRWPRVGEDVEGWVKWRLAKFFRAGWFGYEEADWKALGEQRARKLAMKGGKDAPRLERREKLRRGGGTAMVGLREPNTFSYALCDSPVGLLSLVCSALRKRSPKHQLSKTEIIDITQLAWLPGPEAGIRFWNSAEKEIETLQKEKRARSRVAVTVFGADGLGADDYICPAWASKKHDVVFAQRVDGTAGLLAWERSDVLLAGIKGLAKAIGAIDPRLKARPLEEVVVLGENAIPEEPDQPGGNFEDDGMQMEVESPDTVVALNLT